MANRYTIGNTDAGRVHLSHGKYRGKMDEYLFDDLSMELRSLFDMVKEPLVESFFLKGEPDHCLGTCLKRCPESLLDVIAEEYGLELGRGKERKRQLESLEHKIIEGLSAKIEAVPANELQLLIKLAVEECETEEAAEGLSLQKNGWVFYYVDEEEMNTTPVVPYEIVDKIKELAGEMGFASRMAYYEMVRSYISTFLRLYGVFETKWLFEVIRKHDIPAESAEEESTAKESMAEKSEDMPEKGDWLPDEAALSDEILEKAVVRLKEESENFGLEAGYLFDPDLEDEEEYKERFDAVKDMPYYEPSFEDLLFYHENYIDAHLKEYRILKRYLSKRMDSSMEAEQLLGELSIEAVEELGGVFAVSEIMERYEGIFSSGEELKEFEQLFRDWEDHVRKWNNRGFTNAEMRARGEHGCQTKIEWDLTKIKFKANTPDPDAPCPCGSGKKYRQCCGRVKK